MKRRIMAAVAGIAFGLAVVMAPVVPAKADQDVHPVDKAETALQIIEALLRPSVIVIGFVAGILLSAATVIVLNGDVQQTLDQQGASSQPALGVSIAAHVGGLASGMASTERPMTSLGSALSCPVFVGEGTLLGEDSCVWSKLTGQRTTQAGTNEDSASWRIGGQAEIAPGWYLGGALGAGPTWSQWGSVVSGRGQTFDGSLALKYVSGPWLLAGAVTVGGSSTHYQRFPGSGITMQSDANLFQAGVRLRGAYDAAFAGWYLRPRLDLDGYYTSLAGFQEYGPGIAVMVNGRDKVGVAIAPTLELGGRIAVGPKTILRPYAAGGAVFLPDNSWSLDTSFVGPLSAFGSSPITYAGPNVLGVVEAGLQLYQERGLDVKAEYRLATGNSVLSQNLSLRGAWHF